jgi:hypothetical protein
MSIALVISSMINPFFIERVGWPLLTHSLQNA